MRKLLMQTITRVLILILSFFSVVTFFQQRKTAQKVETINNDFQTFKKELSKQRYQRPTDLQKQTETVKTDLQKLKDFQKQLK